MDQRVIEKQPRPASDPAPNLTDYASERERFRWDDVRGDLDGLPAGGINIAHEAVDRHVAARGDQVAMRFLGRDGAVTHLTYAQLARRTNRFANVLRDLGVGPGERVFSLAGRIPELYVAALGTLKNRCVFAPLFSAFGPEPIATRIERGDGAVLVTTRRLYDRKIAGIRDQLPSLRHVLIAEELGMQMDAASDDFSIPVTDEEELALLHFTSGTTGRPKGAMHVHGAVVAHYATGRLALDIHRGDVYWCTADPGWVTGTSYGIIAPLVCGATCIIDTEEFDVDRWYGILEEQRVNVWYTAPTAIRMLMRRGAEAANGRDLSALRHMASVGEPLNPEAVVWGREVFGQPFHDNWWQTETGAIMISNYASMDVRPGSMGRPFPGIEAAIVKRTDQGEVPVGIDVIRDPDVEGELAVRKGWPSMFRGYLHDDERYANCFAGDWYLSGDLARRDEDGYFWFVGRADDVIKSAGHLIGPFEVESAIMEHEAVAEVGVIGVPDPVAMEVVKAFVALQPGFEPSAEVERSIMAHARKRLGPAVAPRSIAFTDDLPKTRSGKIMRRLLKARELDLPLGDLSTLEKPAS